MENEKENKMKGIETINVMKNSLKQIISLAVPTISEVITQNWLYLRLNLLSPNMCKDFKDCIKFEVYIYILVYFDYSGINNEITNELREYTRKEIETQIRNEFKIELIDENIDNRLKFYSTAINAANKITPKLQEASSTHSVINSIFFSLLKRICTTSNLNEYVNIPKEISLQRQHISDLGVSNLIQLILTVTSNSVISNVIVNNNNIETNNGKK
jgi:hypothetical protein